MAMPKKEVSTEIHITEIVKGRMDFCVLGQTPLICNRLSEKAKRQLLLPAPKKNAAARAESLKHEPIAEFRASPYIDSDANSPTLILMPSTAFKGALRSAALDTPGASKAEIGRLTYVLGMYVAIFGVPQMLMSVVRSADAARTPDVRTRAIIPEWACRISIEFVKPIVTEKSVANLAAAAGLIRGVGDYRPEKGAGAFGQFRLVSADDKDFLRITKQQGRAAQQNALEAPECFDDETRELLSWFDVETKRRGLKVAA